VKDPAKVVWLSQTTLSVDETMETVRRLRERFPELQDPPSDDICYATQNRQVAIKKVAKDADLVIVVGSANSSNSVRLVEVALEYGAKAAYRVDYAHEIQQEWLDGVETVGVTSGASVPEVLVQEVLADLAGAGYADVEQVRTAEEDLMFSLPRSSARMRGTPGRPCTGRAVARMTEPTGSSTHARRRARVRSTASMRARRSSGRASSSRRSVSQHPALPHTAEPRTRPPRRHDGRRAPDAPRTASSRSPFSCTAGDRRQRGAAAVGLLRVRTDLDAGRRHRRDLHQHGAGRAVGSYRRLRLHRRADAHRVAVVGLARGAAVVVDSSSERS
jgi:hypothetical protein